MENSILSRYQRFAPLFLRVGLALVFFLFGLQKLMNPGQATAEIQLLLEFDVADAAALNFYLGLVEIITAVALLVGVRVRVFALVSTFLVVMFFISFLLKYGTSLNPNLYRDVGLAGASLALFLLGAGPLSIDARKKS